MRCDRAFKTHTAGAPDPGSAHEFSVLVPGAGMAKTKPGKERVEESKQEQAEDVQRKRQKLESSRALPRVFAPAMATPYASPRLSSPMSPQTFEDD